MHKSLLTALSPAVITGLYLVVAISNQILISPSATLGAKIVGTAVWLLVANLTLAWMMSLYIVATQYSPVRDQKGVSFQKLVFIATMAAFTVAIPISAFEQFAPVVHFLLLSVPVLLYVISAWFASDALLEAERRAAITVSPQSRIGTFLSIFYLVIGVWFLRSRIERLLRE